jgi:hypothetical protein
MKIACVFAAALWLFAFATETLAQSQPPCLRITRFWTSYDALPQNGAVDVKLAWKAKGCLIPSKVNGRSELYNVTVAVQDISGLDAHVNGGRLNSGPYDAGQELQLDLRVTASPELPLGKRMFLARIDYDALDHTGALHRERLYTPILITVVGEKALVKQHYEPGERWNPWQLLALPVSILEYLAEMLTGQIC